MISKHIYVVLGGPRSGTSVITKGLNVLGIPLGPHLTPADRTWNPSGFWEDKDIVNQINRAVLYEANYLWMSLNLLESLPQSKKIQDLKINAIEILKDRFKDTAHFGFKDPRTVKLLPFWQSIFQQLGLHENYLIVLRNPLASAYSHHRLRAVSIEEGLLLWLMHMIPAISDTQNKTRVIVCYESLLKDPEKELLRVSKAFQLPAPNPEKLARYIHQFLDTKLHHHNADYAELLRHPSTAISPLCAELYDLLYSVSQDKISFDSAEFEAIWSKIKTKFDQLYPIYNYIDRLHKKNKALEKKLRSLQRSVPWRIIYPLRKLDDWFRIYRHKRREKHRLAKQYAE